VAGAADIETAAPPENHERYKHSFSLRVDAHKMRE
jgi:hypothetical protein